MKGKGKRMPNRIIKESICTSDNIDGLSPFEENVFVRLIVNCDDFGRFDAREKILASRLFPLKALKPGQIMGAIRSLVAADLITVYEVDGKPFLQMRTWEKHQQIRAKKSKYPSPDEGTCNHLISDDIKCPRNPIQSNTIRNPNTKAEEEPQKRFTPPTVAEVAEYCKERGNSIDPEYFVAYNENRNWTLSNGRKMKDWKLAIVTWEKRDFNKPKTGKQVPAQQYSQRDYSGAEESVDEMMNRVKGAS